MLEARDVTVLANGNTLLRGADDRRNGRAASWC